MTDKLIEQIKAEKEEGPVEEGVATVRSEYLNAMEDRILADAKRIEAERQRAEKAEAEVERLTGLYASGCVEEYDNGDRVCVWGWAGGAAPGGHLSTLSVSYEAADGSRWNRTYRATEGWEEAPLAALRQDEGDE
jgi:hypothetical protein